MVKKVFLFLAILTVATAMAEPAQVIVIRHAEKPKDPNALHLTSAGEKRATNLVAFFNSADKYKRQRIPTALFATKETKKGGGQRTKETLEPLSKELKVPIEMPYKSDEYQSLARLIRSDPAVDGKVVLICWTHQHIPKLIAAFGVQPEPPKLENDDYDQVYIIDFQEGKARLRMIRQDPENTPTKSEQLVHHRKKSATFDQSHQRP